MQAGYDTELTDEQRRRTPVSNLRANDRFDTDFGVTFDYAIANSVFTHVSLNHIRLCMYRLDKVMAPGGSFFATYFVRKDSVPIDAVKPVKRRNKGYFTEKNNYVYYKGDLRWTATWGDWAYEFVGDWGHPAAQQMAKYTKLTPEQVAAREEAKARAANPGLIRRVARRVLR